MAQLLLIACSTAAAGPFLDRTDQTPFCWLFLPPDQDPSTPLPLVIMLHGCRQDAEMFARITRMNEVVAQHGFALLYPEQTPTANPLRCWRWYEPAHQARGEEGAGGKIRATATAPTTMRLHSMSLAQLAGVSDGVAGSKAEAVRDLLAQPGRLLTSQPEAGQPPPPRPELE